MKPSLYGVDIILHPEDQRGSELHEQGKVIEINGVNSGASFHRIGNREYFYRVMREVQECTGNKAILTPYHPGWDIQRTRSETIKEVDETYYEKKLQDMQRTYDQEQKRSGFRHLSQHLIDRIKKDHKRKDKFETSTLSLYARVGRELGMPIISSDYVLGEYGMVQFREIDVEEDFAAQMNVENLWNQLPAYTCDETFSIPFTFTNRTISMNDIGLLWFQTSNAAEKRFGRERLLNTYFAEMVLDNKALMHFYADFLPDEKNKLKKFLPESFLAGPGLYTKQDFAHWMHGNQDSKFVVKPLAECQGVGVHFLERDQVLSRFSEPLMTDEQSEIEEAYRKLLFDRTFFRLESIIGKSLLIQKIAPSIQVANPVTGVENGACARVIVLNGRAMGGFWRSSTKVDGDLSDRMRHNVCDDAALIPLTHAQNVILSEMAEGAVAAFDETNESVIEAIGDYRPDYLGDALLSPNLNVAYELAKEKIFTGKIMETARAHGVSYRDAIDTSLEITGSNADTLKHLGRFENFLNSGFMRGKK